MNSSISNSRSFRRYSVGVLCAATSVIFLVAFFNWLINPLLLFSSPTIEGLNTYKTEFLANQHRVVPLWAQDNLNETVILGSSRAGTGLDPDHPGFMSPSVFNYSLPGATIDTLAAVYAEASHLSELERVVLTLDFFGFNVMRDSVEIRDQDLESLFLYSATGERDWNAGWGKYSQRISSLVSFHGVRASIRTIQEQSAVLEGTVGYMEYFENGHWRQILPRKRAQLSFIRNTERRYMGVTWLPEPSKQFKFSHSGRSSFESYRKLLSQMYEDNVDVLLVISPFHARFQSSLALVELEDEFESWKRQLLAVNEQSALAAGRADFPLWDFADFGPLNTEDTPENNNSESRMWTYLDGQHYTQELGNHLLDRILNYNHPDRPRASGFGEQLTTENIDSHLLQLRLRKQEYAITHSDDMLDLRNSFSTLAPN